MKLLVDMNLSPRWVDLLSHAGWEAEHWSALGRANAPDSEIMAYAAKRGYVVLTHDLDFSAILAATHGEKPSVVQLRIDDVSPQQAGIRLITALRHTELELQAGALLTIGAQKSRVRLLPLLSRE
jgi:predicted nuclease of predicted toxin-antitoxin system